MPGGEAWAFDVAARFALRMRQERDRLGWSAAELAAACGRLGYDIPRNVISKLEGGYRKYVTLPEWLVISAALDVPPLLFLVPIGLPSSPLPSTGRPAIDARQSEGDGYVSYELMGDGQLLLDPLEIAPTLIVDSVLAFDWLAGERHLSLESVLNPQPWQAQRLWRALDQDLRLYLDRRGAHPDVADESELRELQKRIAERRRRLRGLKIAPHALPNVLSPVEVDAMEGGDPGA